MIDLNLPKNGGSEVLAAMRQSETLSKVPVAIMTSSSAPAEQLRVSALAVQRFITKPPNLEEFLQDRRVVERSASGEKRPQLHRPIKTALTPRVFLRNERLRVLAAHVIWRHGLSIAAEDGSPKQTASIAQMRQTRFRFEISKRTRVYRVPSCPRRRFRL